MAVATPKKTEKSQFAQWLRGQLEVRGWTQEKLARAANLTNAAVGKLVRVKGGATPSLRTAQQIADALDVSLDDIPKQGT